MKEHSNFTAEKPYNDYSSYSKQKFSERVQKISIDAGFTCPNRDGTKGRGGCHYCNNNTFNPFYCTPQKSVKQQLDEGIDFFAKKYKTQKYLAYFQAYSNTYAPVEHLRKLYYEALQHPAVIGLVIGTRPDCISLDLMQLFVEISETYYLVLELGVESASNTTLERINRGHTYEETVHALQLANKFNILTGIHIILGLPGESRDTMLENAGILSEQPFSFLKIHQLQIIKNTIFAKKYEKNPDKFQLFSVDDYVSFVVDFTERLRPDIIIERFISESPGNYLLAPKWGGLKNYQIVDKIRKEFEKRNSWQGKLY